MSVSPVAAAFPRFGDVAHLGHLELFTPTPEASLAFFTSVVGLHETGRSGDSVYLRADSAMVTTQAGSCLARSASSCRP